MIPKRLNDKWIFYLYTIKKLSTRQIAKIYKCSKNTIAAHLNKNGVEFRNHSESKKLRPNPDRYKISHSKLVYLYRNKKLSAYQIANLYQCSPSGIFYKLRRDDIPRRNLSESVSLTNDTRLANIARANIRYPRKNFDGSLEDKAYLIGFKLGDLHVLRRPHGLTIFVSCWSTKYEQILLIQNLFNSYGHINLQKRIKHGKLDIGITCNLNTSFEFLIDDSDAIPDWILGEQKFFLAFVAGYADAEGNFGVDRNWARFSLSTYQQNIILQIYKGLNKFGVICPEPYISIHGGYIDKRGITTRKNLWTLRVNRQSSMLKLYQLVSPYMKHAKRLRDAKISFEAARMLAS